VDSLRDLFAEKQEAWQFLQLHTTYVHNIDDIIDETFDKERLLKSMFIASLIYSCDYFVRNRNVLLPIEHTIINMYADSVDWENCGEEKKKAAADVMRHCQQEMIFAVIKLEFGYETLRKWSGKLREYWLLNH